MPGAIYNAFWDWDAYFICCSIPDAGLNYAKGCVLALLKGVLDNGRPPKTATNKMSSFAETYNHSEHPYPLQAQFAYIIATRLQDFSWVEPWWNTFESITSWYEENTLSHGKYFTWLSLWGNGIDNNPAVYGRPHFSSAGIDLACWHYREYRALSKLSAKLNYDRADYYNEKAEALKHLIQSKYWDQIDQYFYNVDVLFDSSDITKQQITWTTHLKFEIGPLYFRCGPKPQPKNKRRH